MVQNSRVLAGEVVSEGFLGAGLMAKVLDPASPKEVVRDVLMTLSNLSRMNKVIPLLKQWEFYSSLEVSFDDLFVGYFKPTFMMYTNPYKHRQFMLYTQLHCVCCLK